jgi:hypothetical protein
MLVNDYSNGYAKLPKGLKILAAQIARMDIQYIEYDLQKHLES